MASRQWRHLFAGGLLRLLVMLFGLAGVVLISFAFFAVIRLVYLGFAGEWRQLFQGIREIITAGGCFATLFLISHPRIYEIIGWILAAIPIIGYPVVVIQSLRGRYEH